MSTRLISITFILITLASSSTQTFAKESRPHLASEPGGMQALTPGQTQNKKIIIDQIMAESGLDEMLEQLPAIAAMSMNQQPLPPMEAEKQQQLKEDFLHVFDAKKMRQTITDYFKVHYEPQRFAELLSLLKSPLAKKMTALEVEASTPQAQQEMMQMGNTIMGQATPSRLELTQKLDEATGSTETLLDMQVGMAGILMNNMNKIMPEDQRKTEEELLQIQEQMRAQSISPARQYLQLNMVYTFRSVEDAELNEYVQLYQSEIGRWSTALIKNASIKMMEEISFDLAALIEKNHEKNTP